MTPLELIQTESAKALKTTFRTINEIVNEKRGVSPEMALKLARYFDTSPDVWQNLQADYDLYQARQKSKNILDGIKPHKLKNAA
jgi:addiction module HigA family antidote